MTEGIVLGRRQVLLGPASVAATGIALSACGDDTPEATPTGESDGTPTAAAAAGAIEKPWVKLGFIMLTDIAPLAIARQLRFFAEEGLNVTLEAQANWKVLLDGVIHRQRPSVWS